MSFFSNLYDKVTNKSAMIGNLRDLRVANIKRILGSNFGSSIDSTYYTVSVAGTGAGAASNGVLSLTTGATANSTASIVTTRKVRYLSGRANLYRGVMRFGDTGAANNVREFGIQIDSNNGFYFRLSGTTFQIVTRKGGSDTVVSNGSFNGNGTQSAQSWTVDTNFHGFEISYTTSAIRFLIDDVAIHVARPTTTSLTSSVVGVIYASNANSGGGTANVTLDSIALSVSYFGDAVNNPLFYCNSATAETRTLKAGGGTLYSVTIGRAGGAGCTLTIYDNTAASGTIIAIFDMTKDAAIGTHVLAPEGVNFYNGLTYVLSATATAAAFTVTWD